MRGLALIIVLVALIPASLPAALIQPEDLVYRGAFRLPDDGGEYGWPWGGQALAYYPSGDPSGAADGYPGSLFGTGHDWYQYVSEVSIPVPVISPGRDVDDLNTATTLQPFTDIRSLLFGEFEIPYAGLEYLPPQGDQATGKLYFCWYQHLQTSPLAATHGWCEPDLSSPDPAGPWYIGAYDNYSTTDYLFSIPADWAGAHLSGKRLATGRFRDGGQGGQGPCIFACGPWQEGNPPPPEATISAEPLLLYSTSYWDDPYGGIYKMDRYHHSDMWPGGAWLTAGSRAAVVFVGTKGRGDCWYGNQNGPCLDCEDRGWWSTYFDGEIIFYDPDDLAAVAAGLMEPYEPQPYAVMNIDDLLYHVTSPQQRDHVKAASFDRNRGLLYVFEPLADGDKPLVHVWKVGPSASPESLIIESGDYDGDGTDDFGIFRPASGLWAVRGVTRLYFGRPTGRPVPGDYDGDGTSDIGIFRESSGLWGIRGVTRLYYGSSSDTPVPGDYDGDGTCDPGIFRSSSGLWAVRGVTRAYFGRSGDRPVPGVYGGGGADIAIFRPPSGLWAAPGLPRVYYGASGDQAVPGDYNGDGIWEAGIFRASSGLWAVRGVTRFYFGSDGDIPVPADYDGDAVDDFGTFRPSPGGLWMVRGLTRIYYGSSGDLPVTR